MGSRRRHEVAVAFARTEAFADGALAARALACLPAPERRICARIRLLARRRDWLVAHALARTLLAERTRLDPASVVLVRSPLGRPELAAAPGAPDLRVSLSHADGIAVCAVGGGCSVGVDVESLDRVGPNPLDVAGTVCSRREYDALCARRSCERADRLLTLWTLKEAVAKALAVGCHLPFERIEVVEEGDGPLTVRIDTPVGRVAFPGALASLRLSPRHLSALAVLGPPDAALSIRVEEREPGERGLARP